MVPGVECRRCRGRRKQRAARPAGAPLSGPGAITSSASAEVGVAQGLELQAPAPWKVPAYHVVLPDQLGRGLGWSEWSPGGLPTHSSMATKLLTAPSYNSNGIRIVKSAGRKRARCVSSVMSELTWKLLRLTGGLPGGRGVHIQFLTNSVSVQIVQPDKMLASGRTLLGPAHQQPQQQQRTAAAAAIATGEPSALPFANKYFEFEGSYDERGKKRESRTEAGSR